MKALLCMALGFGLGYALAGRAASRCIEDAIHIERAYRGRFATCNEMADAAADLMKDMRR